MSNRLVSQQPPLAGDLMAYQFQSARLHGSPLCGLDTPVLPIHHGLPTLPRNPLFQLPPAATFVPALRRRRDAMKPTAEDQLARGPKLITVHLTGLPPSLVDPHRAARFLPRGARIFRRSQYRHDSFTLPVYSKLYSSTVRVPRVADTHKRPVPRRLRKVPEDPAEPGRARKRQRRPAKETERRRREYEVVTARSRLRRSAVMRCIGPACPAARPPPRSRSTRRGRVPPPRSVRRWR